MLEAQPQATKQFGLSFQLSRENETSVVCTEKSIQNIAAMYSGYLHDSFMNDIVQNLNSANVIEIEDGMKQLRGTALTDENKKNFDITYTYTMHEDQAILHSCALELMYGRFHDEEFPKLMIDFDQEGRINSLYLRYRREKYQRNDTFHMITGINKISNVEALLFPKNDEFLSSRHPQDQFIAYYELPSLSPYRALGVNSGLDTVIAGLQFILSQDKRRFSMQGFLGTREAASSASSSNVIPGNLELLVTSEFDNEGNFRTESSFMTEGRLKYLHGKMYPLLNTNFLEDSPTSEECLMYIREILSLIPLPKDYISESSALR